MNNKEIAVRILAAMIANSNNVSINNKINEAIEFSIDIAKKIEYEFMEPHEKKAIDTGSVFNNPAQR